MRQPNNLDENVIVSHAHEFENVMMSRDQVSNQKAFNEAFC